MLDKLMQRRSIRKFKETEVNKQKIDQLVRAMLLAPTSRNRNPWRFVVITEKELINKLSLAKEHGSAFLKGASLAIVVIADEEKSDVWVEDTSIASIIIQLMAQDLGLGSCWIQIRKRMKDAAETSEDYVKDLLGIPENYKVASIIALGYPDEEKTPHSEEELEYQKVYLNKFGVSYNY